MLSQVRLLVAFSFRRGKLVWRPLPPATVFGVMLGCPGDHGVDVLALFLSLLHHLPVRRHVAHPARGGYRERSGMLGGVFIEVAGLALTGCRVPLHVLQDLLWPLYRARNP